jgi:hypothetical protein
MLAVATLEVISVMNPAQLSAVVMSPLVDFKYDTKINKMSAKQRQILTDMNILGKSFNTSIFNFKNKK